MNADTRREHWESVYRTRRPTEVSWFGEHLDLSLELIAASPLGPRASVIDIGGGASTLVDDLLDRGYREVTVLDISAEAIGHARARLAGRAAMATWIVSDLLAAGLPAAAYDIWHDRAVFHFLIDAADRERYRELLLGALRPGGEAVIATFADDGPLRCSGLDVRRHDAASLAAELGPELELLEQRRHTHITPAGGEQRFIHCRFRRR